MGALPFPPAAASVAVAARRSLPRLREGARIRRFPLHETPRRFSTAARRSFSVSSPHAPSRPVSSRDANLSSRRASRHPTVAGRSGDSPVLQRLSDCRASPLAPFFSPCSRLLHAPPFLSLRRDFTRNGSSTRPTKGGKPQACQDPRLRTRSSSSSKRGRAKQVRRAASLKDDLFHRLLSSPAPTGAPLDFPPASRSHPTVGAPSALLRPVPASAPVSAPLCSAWLSLQRPLLSSLPQRRAASFLSPARCARVTRLSAAADGQAASPDEENVISFSGALPRQPSFTPSVAFPPHKPVPLDSPLSPSVHATPQVRRPGSVVRMNEVIRHWWSVPAVGFNSVLEVPIYRFEVFQRREEEAGEGGAAAAEQGEDPEEEEGCVVLPNDIFGLALRPDILYRCYWFYRRAIAGWTERMQLFKWEWPGSKRKLRPQQRSGRARIGWRKAPGKYVGVKAHPLRPHDQRIKINKRLLWQGLKIMLSAKFAQGQIKVVDHFNLQSHKTKHCVRHLRRILGRKCPSALLVHEGTTDVNDNFRYATAHILAVRRENVEGVNVYNLLKYRQLVITEKALLKLIYNIQTYPEKRGWLPKYATPDGRPAPVPEKVEGWDREWKEMKERERNAKFSKKVPRVDPFKGFRLARFSLHEPTMPWEKFEETYVDSEPLEDEEEGDVFDEAQTLGEEAQRLDRLDHEELPNAAAYDVASLTDMPLTEWMRRPRRLETFQMEQTEKRAGKGVVDSGATDNEHIDSVEENDEGKEFLPAVDRYVPNKS
ncbi:putative 50S ribosomal protein L4 [Neospora caninum Liverpool]|uniref:Large ribosomal subunit protein uL4m n=1 Tax=Neospora caninum (strain Liverpool) TaxID=572307 RepID=F0VK52_NEOCL|nr:putative 50S ribosomal protein L4 [Neospora caninum Liverpool]CBZ54453.1 putative 50S ribosomal protein L4 [Neospora caninum Liverpool]|eukprot:XP_003884483.1 putative 50S ribosomal protein L4 [Neospora caninum Liverpool]